VLKTFINSNFFRLSSLFFIFLGALFFYLYQDEDTFEKLISFVNKLGIYAPLGFILMYAISSIFFISGLFMTLIGGVVFGPFLGSLVNLSGATLGASVAFLISRNFGSSFIKTQQPSKINQIKNSIDEEGWRFVAFVRLVPIFPFVFLNYVLGLTSISFRQYLLVTAICMIPATITYTWVGHVGQLALSSNDNLLRGVIIGCALVGIMIFVPKFIIKRKNKRV
tara:strand:+ start:355 stop:1023 length:669 start_codon:yes stop_codon:yes gene_type:complete